MDKRDKIADLIDDLIDLFHECSVELIPVQFAVPITAALISDMYDAMIDFANYLDSKI